MTQSSVLSTQHSAYLSRRGILLAATILLALPALLRADAAATGKQKLVYVPPSGFLDKTRVMAIPSRSINDTRIPPDLALVILCPDHTGLTVQEHPSIFWYMNKPVKGVKYKLTIYTDNDAEPLIEKQLDPEKDTGIQRLDLKDLAKTLLPNTDYKVSVAIILNAAGGSKDLVATGQIKRIPAPEKLISKLLTRPVSERPVVFASQGFWYDALAAISDQIAVDPKNKELHEERAGLLKQVGLEVAAANDTP